MSLFSLGIHSINYQSKCEIEFYELRTGNMNKESSYSKKSFNVLSLCYVLGIFGAHQFYLGNNKAGFLRLILFLSIIGIPIALILFLKDGIQIMRSKLMDSEGAYVKYPSFKEVFSKDALKANYQANQAKANKIMGITGKIDADEESEKENQKVSQSSRNAPLEKKDKQVNDLFDDI